MGNKIDRFKQFTGHDTYALVFPRKKAIIWKNAIILKIFAPESFFAKLSELMPDDYFDNAKPLEIDQKILKKTRNAETCDDPETKNDIKIFRDCYSRGECTGWILTDKTKIVVCKDWD